MTTSSKQSSGLTIKLPALFAAGLFCATQAQAVDLCPQMQDRFIFVVANGYTGTIHGKKKYQQLLFLGPNNEADGMMSFDNGQGDPIRAACNDNRLSFIRKGDGFVQAYQGWFHAYTADFNENGEQNVLISGTFTHNGGGTYPWHGRLQDAPNQ